MTTNQLWYARRDGSLSPAVRQPVPLAPLRMTSQLSNDILRFLSLETTKDFLAAATKFFDILEDKKCDTFTIIGMTTNYRNVQQPIINLAKVRR